MKLHALALPFVFAFVASGFAADTPPSPAPPKPQVAIDNLPARASLTDVEKRFTNRQRGGMFCIPCGIESAFKYYGINDVTQERLVLSWVKAGGKLRGRSQFVNTRGMTDQQIIESARGAVLWGANFNNFKQVTEGTVGLNALGYEMGFGVMKNLDQYACSLKHAVANDWVFIMSLNLGGGAHIVNVVAYDGDKVTLWEPAGGKFHTKRLADFNPNLDLLILRPIQKTP